MRICTTDLLQIFSVLFLFRIGRRHRVGFHKWLAHCCPCSSLTAAIGPSPALRVYLMQFIRLPPDETDCTSHLPQAGRNELRLSQAKLARPVTASS